MALTLGDVVFGGAVVLELELFDEKHERYEENCLPSADENPKFYFSRDIEDVLGEWGPRIYNAKIFIHFVGIHISCDQLFLCSAEF